MTTFPPEHPLFREVADIAPVMIWMAGLDKLCSYFNRPWLEFTGRDLNDELGNGWADGIHPDDFERCLRTYERAFDAREAFTVEYRLRRHDGAYRWVLDNGKPIYSASSEFVGYAGSCIDITDQKDIQAALEKSEERYRFAMDITSEGIWDFDIETGEHYISPSYFTDLGYELSDLGEDIRKQMVDLIHPEDRDATLEAINRALESKGAFFVEYRQLAKNGDYRWMQSRGRVFSNDSNNNPTRIVGTHSDIDARKKAEIALRESERLAQAQRNQLEAIYRNTPVGLGIFDLGLRYRRINEKLAEFGGLSAEQHIGMHISQVIPAFTPSIEAATKKVLETGEPFNAPEVEGPIATRPGHYGRFSHTWYPIFDERNEINGLGVVVQDVTIERAAQREIENAKVMAEEAAAAKTNFLANMSHEIRTPMNAIIGMTHLALKAEPNPRVRNYLQKIETSSEHLLGIINDVLDYSKIEANKMSLETICFELDVVVEKAIALIAESASVKNLRITVDVGSDVPRQLVGDPLRLDQMLVNYLNNAVKFSEDAEIVIAVENDNKSEDEAVLKFSVRDNGIGIAEEQRQRLFQSFQQLDSSTTRKYGGSGLGLVIVKRLAEAMGGTVGVESVYGQGANFWFTAKLGVCSDQVSPELGRAKKGDSENLSGVSILLVEDNELNQEVAAELLKELGISVKIAENGAVAVAMARREIFDLILMDVQMPVMDGIAATIELRQDPALRDIPILAMTAGVMSSDRERCLAAGMNDHIPKPIDPDSLRSTLINWLPVEIATRVHSEGIRRDDQLDPLKTVEGLDVEDGLRRVAGKRSLYVSLLRKFTAGQKGITVEISEALEAGQLELAERLVHTLKSVSGNIGAVKIHLTSVDLEKKIKDRSKHEMYRSLIELRQKLSHLMSQLEVILPTLIHASPMEIDTAILLQVYDRLLDLLAEQDPGALDVFQEHSALLQAALPECYDSLKQSIESYDFDTAARLLAEARAAWKF